MHDMRLNPTSMLVEAMLLYNTIAYDIIVT